MKFAFIDAKKVAFPVQSMCRVLGVSRSGFYAWKKRPAGAEDEGRCAARRGDRGGAQKRSRGDVRQPPRSRGAARREACASGRKRVERLMREDGIQARRKRRFRRTTDSNHPNPIAPNVLAREFDAALRTRSG